MIVIFYIKNWLACTITKICSFSMLFHHYPLTYLSFFLLPTPLPSGCFISHIGVFLGGFLVPMLLIILFNTSIFTVVVVIIVRHKLRRTKQNLTRSSLPLPSKQAVKLTLSLSGIMILLGLTWVISLFTFVRVDTNCDAAFALHAVGLCVLQLPPRVLPFCFSCCLEL